MVVGRCEVSGADKCLCGPQHGPDIRRFGQGWRLGSKLGCPDMSQNWRSPKTLTSGGVSAVEGCSILTRRSGCKIGGVSVVCLAMFCVLPICLDLRTWRRG
jgi:hypothetical protein